MTKQLAKESERLISEWKVRLEKFPASRERLPSVLASLALGREFGESVEEYFDRRGFSSFAAWAKSIAKNN